MKILVVGGTGLIGSKLVVALAEQDHEIVAASPESGVDSLTSDGLANAVEDADVVVDVTNSRSLEADAVLTFFETSTANLLREGLVAGVSHHVALSIVGTDRLWEGGYFRGKMAQENLIKDSPVPYTIVLRLSSLSSSTASQREQHGPTPSISHPFSSSPSLQTRWLLSSLRLRSGHPPTA